MGTSEGRNGNRDVLAGIRLVLEEIRDLKRDAAEDRKQAAEDRKQAAERFDEYCRQAAEDRRRFDEHLRQAAGERREFRRTFANYAADAARREKQMARAMIVIGQVGRRIVKTLDMHTTLLEQIARGVRAYRGGRNGRGSGR